MKIILTGGGTAGHITPNLALVPALRRQGFEIAYVGTRDGLEARLIAEAGLPFYPIRAGKLRRYLDWKNVADLGNIALGFCQAAGVLRRLRPDIVFFTEALPQGALSGAILAAEHCDLMLVIGTSGVVYPAAGLPAAARSHGALLVEVNPEDTALTGMMDYAIRATAVDALPWVAAALAESRP